MKKASDTHTVITKLIPRTLWGEVKSYATRNNIMTEEALVRIIGAGLLAIWERETEEAEK